MEYSQDNNSSKKSVKADTNLFQIITGQNYLPNIRIRHTTVFFITQKITKIYGIVIVLVLKRMSMGKDCKKMLKACLK